MSPCPTGRGAQWKFEEPVHLQKNKNVMNVIHKVEYYADFPEMCKDVDVCPKTSGLVDSLLVLIL